MIKCSGETKLGLQDNSEYQLIFLSKISPDGDQAKQSNVQLFEINELSITKNNEAIVVCW